MVSAGSAQQDRDCNSSRRFAGGLLVAAGPAGVAARCAAAAPLVRLGGHVRIVHGLGGENLHRSPGRELRSDFPPARPAGGTHSLLLCREDRVAHESDFLLPALAGGSGPWVAVSLSARRADGGDRICDVSSSSGESGPAGSAGGLSDLCRHSVPGAWFFARVSL